MSYSLHDFNGRERRRLTSAILSRQYRNTGTVSRDPLLVDKFLLHVDRAELCQIVREHQRTIAVVTGRSPHEAKAFMRLLAKLGCFKDQKVISLPSWR